MQYVFDLEGRLVVEAQQGQIVAEHSYLDGESLTLWCEDQTSPPVSILENGGFESGTTHWQSCANTETTYILSYAPNVFEGAKAIRLECRKVLRHCGSSG